MAFPLNSATTATVIPSLPFTAANTFTGSVTWFVYTAQATDVMIGVHLSSSVALDDPDVTIYQTSALAATFPGTTDPGGPVIQQPVVAGREYYFKLEAGADPTATVTLEIRPQPGLAVQAGDVLVPDASTDDAFPPVAVSFASEAVTRIPAMGAGNNLARLPTGEIALANQDSSGDIQAIKIYASDPLGQLITSLTSPHGTDGVDIAQDYRASFYLMSFDDGIIKRLSNTGDVDPASWSLGGAVWAAFAVNVGGTKVYWSNTAFSSAGAVKAYSLVTSSALSDFAAAVAGYWISDIAVMADDSVVVAYYKPTATTNTRVMRYSSAGATIATWDAPAGHDSPQVHIADNDSDPAYVTIRTEDPTLVSSTFWKLNIADLTAADSFTVDNFDDGEGRNSTDQFFGPSEATSIITLLAYSTPNPSLPATTTTPIRWVRVSPTIESDGKRIRHVRLELMLQNGTGTPTGAGTAPVILQRSSNDGGATFNNTRELPVGETGEYEVVSELWQLGTARRRVYEHSGSGPVPYVIAKVFIDADVLKN